MTYRTHLPEVCDRGSASAVVNGTNLQFRVRVYVGCVFLAHQAKRNDFDTSITEFKKLTRLDPRTVKKAIDNLEERGLICTSPIDMVPNRGEAQYSARSPGGHP